MSRRLRALAALTLAAAVPPIALVSACATARIGAAVSAAEPPRAPGLWASASEVDITPPPGLALFGHGPEGRIARGVRLRLRCQAFVLAGSPEGTHEREAVALVPCDLAAPSLELQREVARRVRAKGCSLGADRIVLFATHTHAGPAHYFGSRKYSGTFSSRQPGFDPAVLDFLAERIAGAIASAYQTLRPACGAWWSHPHVYGLSRNRSLRAHLRNHGEVPAALDAPEVKVSQLDARRAGGAGDTAASPPSCEGLEVPPPPLSPAQAAVDPTLTVLRLAERDGDTCAPERSIGLFAVFGVHPTAIGNDNDLYHGDLFGYATRAARDGRAPGGGVGEATVVGIANGAEGDVSPNWDVQSPREARRLGERLAGHLVCAHDRAREALRADLPVRVAYRDLHWSGAATGGPECCRQLCPVPELGTPAAGGAEDGPTRFRVVPAFNEGFVGPPRACHGVRVPLLGPTGNDNEGGVQFPEVAPLSAVRVGDRIVLAAPAEITKVAADRIRRRVSEATKSERLVVAGLANAYLQYVATEAEYPQQDYEGASTLYGPCSEYFLANHFAALAAYTLGQTVEAPPQSTTINAPEAIPFDPSPAVSRFAPLTNDYEGVFQADLPLTARAIEGYWAMETSVRGVPPAYLQSRGRFSVELLSAATGRLLDDDRGSHFVLELEPHDETWRIRWEPGPTADAGRAAPGCEQESVVLRVLGPRVVQTQPFPPRCGRFKEATR